MESRHAVTAEQTVLVEVDGTGSVHLSLEVGTAHGVMLDVWLSPDQLLGLEDKLGKAARAALEGHRSRLRALWSTEAGTVKISAGGDLSGVHLAPQLDYPFHSALIWDPEPTLKLAEELHHLWFGLAQAAGPEEVGA